MVINVPLALNNYYAFEGMLAFAILIFGCVLPLAVLPNNLRTMRFILSVYVFFHVPTAIYGLLHSGVGISGWVAAYARGLTRSRPRKCSRPPGAPRPTTRRTMRIDQQAPSPR